MKRTLKYGQNPHQKATVELDKAAEDPLALAHYTTPEGGRISTQLSDMSWGALNDLNRGVDVLVRCAAAFEVNTGSVPKLAIVLQHGTASGAAYGDSDQVIEAAIAGNYRASYGSFLITNVEMTDTVALHVRQWMPANRPFSGIAAPLIAKKARGFFARKSKACHLFVNSALGHVGQAAIDESVEQRTIRGAVLYQKRNAYIPKFPKAWDKQLISDMCLAWGVAASSNSTAIAIVNSGRLVANAAGEQERAAACEEAIAQCLRNGKASNLKGAAVASDGYFSFADGVDALGRKKVKAIFATHGSTNDKEVAKHAQSFDHLVFHTVPDPTGRSFCGG
ncbi:MAG: hypothetical protein K0U34_06050 [Alphaproteobacteria bacterium]|nr:hypothetical protein [Alphaproteobacteria bacterium]